MCRLSRSLLLVCLLVGLIQNLAVVQAAEDQGFEEVCAAQLMKTAQEKGYPGATKFSFILVGPVANPGTVTLPVPTTKHVSIEGVTATLKPKDYDPDHCKKASDESDCDKITIKVAETPFTVYRKCTYKKVPSTNEDGCDYKKQYCLNGTTPVECDDGSNHYGFFRIPSDDNCWSTSWRLSVLVEKPPPTTTTTTRTTKAPLPPPPPTQPAVAPVNPVDQPNPVNPYPLNPVTSGPATTPFLPYGGVETAPMTEAPSVYNDPVAPAAANEDSTTEAADRHHLCELFVGSWLLMCYAFH